MVNAGTWYPREENNFRKAMNNFLADKEFGAGEKYIPLNKPNRNTIGGVSPHAGTAYSGPCATNTYLSIFKEKIPDTVIVLGFDHRSHVENSLLGNGEWETPLGNLEIDSDLTDQILNTSQVLISDSSAFIGRSENSLELQMPFIKYFSEDHNVKIVPIKISSHDFKTIDIIASDLAKSIQSSNKDIVVVASSDLYHEHVYGEEDLDNFKKKDDYVINEFIKLQPESILNLGFNASVCGRHTITALLLTCKKLNAVEGKLLKHYTSVEITKKFGYGV